jgi:hypothetical protein
VLVLVVGRYRGACGSQTGIERRGYWCPSQRVRCCEMRRVLLPREIKSCESLSCAFKGGADRVSRPAARRHWQHMRRAAMNTTGRWCTARRSPLGHCRALRVLPQIAGSVVEAETPPSFQLRTRHRRQRNNLARADLLPRKALLGAVRPRSALSASFNARCKWSSIFSRVCRAKSTVPGGSEASEGMDPAEQALAGCRKSRTFRSRYWGIISVTWRDVGDVRCAVGVRRATRCSAM